MIRGTTVFRALAVSALAALLAACGSGDSNRGALNSATQTAALTKAQIDGTVAAQPGLDLLVGSTAKCDVAILKLNYETHAPRGEGASASAGLMIPSGAGCAGPYPIVVYHHGTTVIRSYAMSDPTNTEAGLQLAMFAAQGYVVVMPDYLGYGDSTLGYHPYLHSTNTAVVSIDALRAARRALSDRGVATSGKLFLTGYSQGGHAAMATQRLLERDHASEFSVTAAVPMSGPYALTQSFLEGIDTPGQGATVFVTMTFTGYQKAYGDIYARPEDIFQAPWVTGIENLLPGTLTTTQLFTTGKLPLAIKGTGGLLTSGFVAGYNADPNYPARKRIAENDLLNFKPVAPVALCGGSRDPTVAFKNVTTATTYFASQGVTVTPVDVEQIPSFAPAIAAQVSAAPDLSTYHGTIVPPLCVSFAKNQFFDPRK